MEKYLTAAQRKEQERKEKEEEERRIREQGDNARERGLDMMMGGVLEIKKEDELKKVSPFLLLKLDLFYSFFSFFFWQSFILQACMIGCFTLQKTNIQEGQQCNFTRCFILGIFQSSMNKMLWRIKLDKNKSFLDSFIFVDFVTSFFGCNFYMRVLHSK